MKACKDIIHGKVKVRIIVFILLMVVSPLISNAQQAISLQSAIDTALKNNYDIQIAKNNYEITRANNNYGNAGGLPVINANAGGNYLPDNSYYQKLNSGSVTDIGNYNGNSINAQVNASIVLFNGLKVLSTKKRLSLLEKQGELDLNQKVQNTFASVMITYYDIVRQQRYLRILNSSLELAKKKLDIVNERRSVGMANEADYLQSQIDVNTVEQSIKGQELVIEEGKANLLQAMNAKKSFKFQISDTILIDQNLKLDSVLNYLVNNPQYMSAEMQERIYEQMVREIASQRYPSVHLSTGYSYSSAITDGGPASKNITASPYVGFSLLIPLYNSNIYKTQHDVAKYNVENARIQKENLIYSLRTDAEKTYLAYSSSLQQITSQAQNYDLSKKLMDVVMQRFQLNQATIIDVKTATSSFENSAYMLVNLQYAAKIAEIELNRLVFKLR